MCHYGSGDLYVVVCAGPKASRANKVWPTWRQGLTAETVIAALEDAEDYQAFQAAIVADYDAQSAVERELVLRLASLLWRLHRATTLETSLFEMQTDQLHEFRQARQILVPGFHLSLRPNKRERDFR